jgi:hypothetical protein
VIKEIKENPSKRKDIHESEDTDNKDAYTPQIDIKVEDN